MKQTLIKRDLNRDADMNVGQDTDLYLKAGFNIVAFKADSRNADFCRKMYSAKINRGQLIDNSDSHQTENGRIAFSNRSEWRDASSWLV